MGEGAYRGQCKVRHCVLGSDDSGPCGRTVAYYPTCCMAKTASCRDGGKHFYIKAIKRAYRRQGL